jgi:hypothetical protein
MDMDQKMYNLDKKFKNKMLEFGVGIEGSLKNFTSSLK